MNNELIEQYKIKAFGYYIKSDYLTAIDYYEKIIGLGFESAKLYHKIGVCYHELEKYNQAVTYYLKALKIDFEKTNGEFYYNLAIAYRDLNKFNDGIIICKESLTYFPNSYLIHRILGNLYVCILRSDLAEESFLKAIELNPNDDISYDNLGHMYKTIGEFDKGKKYIDKGFEILHKNLNK